MEYQKLSQVAKKKQSVQLLKETKKYYESKKSDETCKSF